MSSDNNPIERKVQLTGGSTYTVSLPKGWANGQEIEPGASVDLYTRGEQLIVTRGPGDPEPDRRTATIEATDHTPETLGLCVGAAYVAGCEKIRVDGLRDSTERRTVARSIRRFVGLEVMTEDETSLTAQTMLDAADLSPEQTLAQLQRTALEMHADAVDAVIAADGDLGQQIAQQDDTVDRLFALVSRGFQRSLVDPAVALSREDLSSFEYYMAARQLERVADHAEKIATIAGRLEGPPPEGVSDALRTHGDDAREIVSDSIDGLVGDGPAATTILSRTDDLLAAVETLDEDLYDRTLTDSYLLGVVLDSIVRTAEYGANVAEAGLQAQYRPDL
jgi:phosphate uptake regulator